MAKCIFRDGMTISDHGRPYVVAEVNSSHNGDMEVAKRMIDAAVSIGCDCVKFQSWSVSSLYSKTYYDENPIAKRFVKKFSMGPEQLKELADYCTSKNISFASTPYSEEEVDFLVEECAVPFIKIASMEVNNPNFLRYIGQKGVPIVLSTGMSTYEEVDQAVSILHEAGVEQMVILHCVSMYPTSMKNVNLNNIIRLREMFTMHPIGFSDHTDGDAAAVAAVALGAGLIEKHLTLDKTKVGMDNGMATEPDIFAQLVSKCRETQLALGTKDRVLTQEEIDKRRSMRRSIVSKRDIKAGEVIVGDVLYAKRPGTGYAPNEAYKIIGRKAAMDIKADTVIIENQLCD